MIAIKDVRVVPRDGQDTASTQTTSPRVFSHHRHAAPLRSAILRTRQWLLSEQQRDGYWVGELEGDSILQSETVLLLAYLGRENSPLAQRAARRLVETQLPEGGWSLYPGAGIEISASVKAYFALKLTGRPPSDEVMQRARRAILAAGGADRVNSFTRFYLALLGQIDYAQCPAVPPEMMLLPTWFPINLQRVSAWSRTIIVPLSIMSALRPVRRIALHLGIRELFLLPPHQWPPLSCPGQQQGVTQRFWSGVFRRMDGALKWCQRHRLHPFRKRALALAEQWMLERFEGSDGLGAIFPPIVWSTVALDCLGYPHDSPEVQYCYRQLEDLVIEEGDSARIQPCKSPIWDTAITLRALADSGVDRHQGAMQRAVDWLLEKEVHRHGDWAATVKADPGGWAFEHHNEFYPDLDDTAMVLLALRHQLDEIEAPNDPLPPELQLVSDGGLGKGDQTGATATRPDRITAAGRRAVAWMLAMQNRDGGWGAFDRNNNREVLCHVPFADHNAMIDPSSPDLTARVLEALGKWGYAVGDPAVDRAVDYLRKTQQADGSWEGRWGVNYIYGTWQTLVGLAAIGVDHTDPVVQHAANWLLAYQQPSGGWGESPESYADHTLRGQGPVTASQTAWALLGLMSAGYEKHASVADGIRYLLDAQQPDGRWEEPEFTGTGFPQVFYLRYHMYPIYFPLMALSRWAVALAKVIEEADTACQRMAGPAMATAGKS
jgi:squalene-hopene/tetraprenyl-beta-curcumene cyclase